MKLSEMKSKGVVRTLEDGIYWAQLKVAKETVSKSTDKQMFNLLFESNDGICWESMVIPQMLEDLKAGKEYDATDLHNRKFLALANACAGDDFDIDLSKTPTEIFRQTVLSFCGQDIGICVIMSEKTEQYESRPQININSEMFLTRSTFKEYEKNGELPF